MMNKPDAEFEEILEICLDLLQERRESIETLLARYPDYADELRPALEAAVWLQERRSRLEPQQGFVATSRRRVMHRIRHETRQPFLDRIRRLAGSYSQRRGFAFALTSLLVIFVLLFAGGGSIALAAQESLPGDTFYPVKLGLEKAAILVASSDRQTDLHIQYVERRLIEIQELAIEGRYEHISDTVTNLESQVNAVIEDIDEASSQDSSQAREIASSLSLTLKRQTLIIDMLSSTAPKETKPLFDRARQVSQTGLVAAESVLGEDKKEDPEEEIEPPTVTATLVETPSTTPTATFGLLPTGTFEATGDATDEVPIGTRLPPWITITPTPTPRPTDRVEEPTRTPTFTPTLTPTQPTPTSPPELPTQAPTPGRPTPTIAPTETPVDPSTSTGVTETAEPFEEVKPTKTPRVKPPKDVPPGLEANSADPEGKADEPAPAKGLRAMR